jgi:hypothetical protein
MGTIVEYPPLIAQISPPQAPQPPAAPVLPSPPIPGTSDPRAIVRRLVTMMKGDKSADVLSSVTNLASSQQTKELEEALIDELTQDELTKYGYELRRVIRFVLAKDAGIITGKNGTPFTVSAGQEQVTRLVDGVVKLNTAVKLTTGYARDSREAYTISFEGPADNMHWLQFIWRQMTAVYPPSAAGSKSREVKIKMRQNHAGRAYLLTTDENRPRWTTDGAIKDRPFYEEGTTVKRTSNKLMLADDPSRGEGQVAPLFNSAIPPDKCISTFHAATYLIKDIKVLYRADVELHWTIRKQKVGPAGWIAYGRVANQFDAAHRAALALQFPAFDYLPGPLIEAPVPRDEFDPVSLVDPLITGWAPGRTPLQRYETAAAIGKANLIEDVEDDPLKINQGNPKQGLNYLPTLGNPGQTGYIDEKAKFHNPDLPAERFAARPKVAIILGDQAFIWGTAPPGGKAPNEREKAYSIATMRHEMAHAAHNMMAIGWLLKWRDELTKTKFQDWLSGEKKAKRITEVDFELVSTGLPPNTLGPTEALAWTEGFVTALPFLPTQPDLASLLKKEVWPAAISELEGILKYYENLKSDEVQKAVKRRIETGICGVLRKDEKETLIKWIKFLLELEKLSPKTSDENKAVADLETYFSKNKMFLKEIRKIAQNCPA